MHGKRGKNSQAAHGKRYAFAFLHGLLNAVYRICNNQVADDFPHNSQRLQQRHAAGDERSERAAEARHFYLQNQRIDQGQLKHEFVTDQLALFRGGVLFKPDIQADAGADNQPPVMLRDHADR